jgi:hypothetical protein
MVIAKTTLVDDVMRQWPATLERLKSDWIAARAYSAPGADMRSEMARDVGISVGMLSLLVSRGGSGAGQVLPRLLRAVDLRSGDVRRRYPDVVRDMQAVCSTCTVKRRCRRDLTRPLPHLTFQTCCPNAPTIADLGGRIRQVTDRA